MLEKVKVTGVKLFNGEINGDKIDSGNVFIEERLDESKGDAKGVATVKYPLGSSEKVKSIMHNEFPLICEVEFARVTNGSKSMIQVRSIKPVSSPAANSKQ